MKQNDHICIVTPVFNDWDCLLILHGELQREFALMGRSFTLLAVNDGSTLDIPKSFINTGAYDGGVLMSDPDLNMDIIILPRN